MQTHSQIQARLQIPSMMISLLAIFTILLASGLTSATAKAELSCEAVFNRETSAAELKLNSAKLRLANATSGPIEISAGRNVFIQVVAPETAETPFYLFLPGSNRSLFLNEAQTQNLVLTGAGVGAMNFSTQPHSIASLVKGVRPAFYSHEMKLADFAQEVEATIANLKKRGYKNVIPVSLSYSGVLSPMLNVHDLIIETSPMTSMAAARPDLEKALELQRMTNFWNPFFAPSINRALLDKAYRDSWASQADTMIKQFQLPAERRQDFIEGYTSMSRAAEGSKWDNFDLSLTQAKNGADSRMAGSNAMPSAGSRRVFIVGGNESPVLLKNQLQTFLALSAADPRTLLVVIDAAGHVVPSDQPIAYHWALEKAVEAQNLTGGPFIYAVTGDSNQDASTGKGANFDLIKGNDAIKAVQLMLEKLK